MAEFPLDSRLVIEPAKLHGYLLNREHEIGNVKAEFFLENGFSREDVTGFRLALETHVRTRPVVTDVASAYGRKMVVECGMCFPNGKERCVRAVWISEQPLVFRLVTCYPTKSQAQ